jgi:glutathione synthase/RimK-type ligase-like ATP-grasp enzyme
MPRPRIAIATCDEYAGLKADDDLLLEALRARGSEAQSVVWDDEGADWSGFDGCLVRSTWDYNRKYDEFLAWVRQADAQTALHNPAELIAWNSDKTYLRELGERGVSTIPTAWIGRGSEVDLEEVLAARGWEEAVVKPAVDLGAKNLHRVRAGSGEGQAALEAVLEQHEAMVQPFLPSLEEQGELSLIYIAGELSHAVRKRPAEGDFRVQSIWGGSVSPAQPDGEAVELAERALALIDPAPLYARADLVEGPDGAICLIELELIEPNLYLTEHPSAEPPSATERLAEALLACLR